MEIDYTKGDDVCNLSQWRIWHEGYRCSGMECTAQYVGTSWGHTFEEACRNWYAEHPSPHYNKVNNTLWGMHHFDNEADARKSFG